jgi:hypothetical protein
MANKELYVLLSDTVDGDECFSTWKERNLGEQAVDVVVSANDFKFGEESIDFNANKV